VEHKPLANGIVLRNRYQITRLVAGGGMAWVYEVQELRADGTRQVWAMKELRADADDAHSLEEGRRLFEQEANILVHLSHPNLPKVVAFFEEYGRSYLVMEFIYGESMEKRLEHANAPILELQALDWATQICEVLTYLHTRPSPVIFRDMKPSNVMVTLDGRIKLIDFGIARTYKVGKRKDTISMGSENYAAPEQWGKTQTDARADIYGLGATLYHLLTNVPPLPAFVPTQRVSIQQYNPAVSDATVAVVEKAMSKDRERRYPTAEAMRQALLDCMPKRERSRLLAERQRLDNVGQSAAPVASVAPSVLAAPAATIAPASAPMQATEADYSKVCPRCATLNRPAARFCRNCGYVYVEPLPPVLKLLRPANARWEYPLRNTSTLIGRPGGVLPVDLDLSYYDGDSPALDPTNGSAASGPAYVSRNHARISPGEGANIRRFTITDVGSSNGTFVNGQRLEPHVTYLLRDGDRIRLGRIVLHFGLR